MSANISAHQIDHEALRQLVSRALWDTGLEPRGLEITVKIDRSSSAIS